MTSGRCVLLSCGEASGDLYLGRIAEALFERRSDLRLVGVVGERGRAAGVEPWGTIDELAVMGFSEIVRHLPRLYRFGSAITERAVREGVDLFVPVDYAGLHLRMAARLQRHGIPTIDFIPPKTWSWGRHRLRALRRHVEHCAVIFPFEEEHYRGAGIPTTFVGHPLVDLHAAALGTPAPMRQGLLLVPGSRRLELARLMPVLADVVRLLRSRLGEDLVVRASRAPGVRSEWLAPLTRIGVEIAEGELMGHLRSSRAAIVCSGTATMETAMSATPHVIVYRTSRLTYALARRMATVEHIGMANIVLGRRAFPEFLQQSFRPAAVAEAVAALFLGDDSPEVAGQRAASAELLAALGDPGCFSRVADLVVRRLEAAAPPRAAMP